MSYELSFLWFLMLSIILYFSTIWVKDWRIQAILCAPLSVACSVWLGIIAGWMIATPLPDDVTTYAAAFGTGLAFFLMLMLFDWMVAKLLFHEIPAPRVYFWFIFGFVVNSPTIVLMSMASFLIGYAHRKALKFGWYKSQWAAIDAINKRTWVTE